MTERHLQDCAICARPVSLAGRSAVQMPESKRWAHDVCIKYLAHKLEAGELKRGNARLAALTSGGPPQ